MFKENNMIIFNFIVVTFHYIFFIHYCLARQRKLTVEADTCVYMCLCLFHYILI